MANLPSLRQLRYFVALAEQLNFTRAAQDCFVSQSTLSAGLRELEQMLGARLVERDRQSVLLTPLGEQMLPRAKTLLAAATDLVQLAAGAAMPMTGILRLGIIPTIAPFLLPQLIPGLRAQYPELKLALREDLTANLLDRLDSGQLDFALIALPYDTRNLQIRTLFKDEFYLVAPADDPLLASEPLRMSAALSERLLLLEEGHCLRQQTLLACERAASASPDGLEATSLLTLVQMVVSGLGLALIPAMAVQAGLLAQTGLRACRLAAPAPVRTIALAARRSTVRLAELEVLADFIRCQQGEQSGPQVLKSLN